MGNGHCHHKSYCNSESLTAAFPQRWWCHEICCQQLWLILTLPSGGKKRVCWPVGHTSWDTYPETRSQILHGLVSPKAFIINWAVAFHRNTFKLLGCGPVMFWEFSQALKYFSRKCQVDEHSLFNSMRSSIQKDHTSPGLFSVLSRSRG